MELNKAIAELYRVFQPYRLSPDFTGCGHCVDPRESDQLARTPLRELSLEDLRRYAFKAMTTWGEVSHFKHFLPRLFELAVVAPTDFELEVLFGKLDYSKWQAWPSVERRCIERYLRAFWLATIQQPPSDEHDDRIDSILCAIGNTNSSIRSFLDDWLNCRDAAALRQLAQFVAINYESVTTRDRLASAYWKGHEANAAEVIAWLKQPIVSEYLVQHQNELAQWQKAAVPLLAAIQAPGSP